MRCVSCNEILTDKEATRKSHVTGEYVDMCSHCLGTILDELDPGTFDPDDDIWDEILEDDELLDP